MGQIFIGLPKTQGAMVVYDTGSDWLTVKAAITEQHSNKVIDKEATQKKLLNIAKKKGIKLPAGANKNKTAPTNGASHLKKHKEDKEPEAASGKDEDTDNDGDGISKPFSNPNKEKKLKQ